MLHLHEVAIPLWPFGPISLFSTHNRVLSHLCDHLLTRPEANGWSQLLPSYRDHLDPDDDDGLYRFARSLWTPRPPLAAAQQLYDDYGTQIVRAVSEAIRHGWFWAEQEEEEPTWRGLGTSGVFVIWTEHTIRTAMLLGYTAPPVEDPDGRLRKKNPLPRQHAWRYRGAQLRHDDAHYPPAFGDDAVHAQYHLFKKGAVRIRREYKHAWQAGRVTGGGAYLGSLHAGVPTFDAWQRLRTPPPIALPHALCAN